MTAPKSQLRLDAGVGPGLVDQLNQVLARLQVQDEVRYGVEPSARPVRSVTTATTLKAGDAVLLCDATGGAITVTLMPLADVQGRVFHIKKTDAGANAVTIDPNGAETIDGAATAVITAARENTTIVATPTEWFII